MDPLDLLEDVSDGDEDAEEARGFAKLAIVLQNVLQFFWRARSRLYRNEILQENRRLTAFFKLYKMCTRLHRSKLNIFSKKSY